MKRAITVRLDPDVAVRVERAARSRNLTIAGFLAQVSDDAAHQALFDDAVARYQRDPGAASLSELAHESGLAVEEIMRAIWQRDRLTAAETGRSVAEVVAERSGRLPALPEDVLLAAAQTVAEDLHDPGLVTRARSSVAAWRQQRAQGGAGAE